MSEIFGGIGIATGVIFYFSPALIIYNLHKQKITVENTSGLGIFTSFISSLLWIAPFFSNVDSKKNQLYLFMISNMLGTTFSFCWNILYLYYFTQHKKLRYTIYIIAIIDVAAEIILIELDNKKDNKTEEVYYWIAAAFNIAMYISPGLNLIKVFRLKNRELISLPGSILGVLNCGAWLLFNGFIKKPQPQLYVANGIGLGLCFIQIFLYWLFTKPKKIREEQSTLSIRDNPEKVSKFDKITESENLKDEKEEFFNGFI